MEFVVEIGGSRRSMMTTAVVADADVDGGGEVLGGEVEGLLRVDRDGVMGFDVAGGSGGDLQTVVFHGPFGGCHDFSGQAVSALEEPARLIAVE